MHIKYGRIFALLFCAISLGSLAEPIEKAELIEVRRIWDKGAHNAFTDLARFKDKWFCAFREGAGHVSPDGAIRIIESKDGKEWSSAALIRDELGDLRDPKITVAPGKRLMLTAAIAVPQPNPARHWSVVSFSDDGRQWSKPYPVGEANVWMWRNVWNEGKCYGLGYATDQREFVRLYQSDDGLNFETLVPELVSNKDKLGEPNECALLFLPDKSAACLVRRDGQPAHGLLGKARPPYKDWEWKDIGLKIGGPQMIRLSDGQIIAGVRLYDGGVRTSLIQIDPESGKATEILKLPSGGDTSYPGMVWEKGILWMSYYSSHEKKTSIYLAKVKLQK